MLDLRNVLLEELDKANKANPAGFDLFPRFHRFTFECVESQFATSRCQLTASLLISTITRLTFGSEVKAMTTEHGADYSHRFDRWLTNASIMTVVNMMLGEWAHFLIPRQVREWKEDGDAMWALLQEQKERIERGEARNSIMDDAYAIAMSEKMPSTISDSHLRKALMSVLFAGRGLFGGGDFLGSMT